jgi:hypothetical protein
MLAGRYRDVVTDARGMRLAATPWRANLLVDEAFTLLARLLAREPDTQGILFWAVGSGKASWDRSRPPAVSRTSRLTTELRRLEVPREAFAYVDDRGAPSDEPPPNLELTLVFEWSDQAVTLREFGIFGGDAGPEADSGTMINHVIHRRIELQPAQRLTRELRLAFGRAGDRRWFGVPPHWLADSEAHVVGGVGDRFAKALADAGIDTVADLAGTDLPPDGPRIPRLPMTELRTKALLALRTAVEVHPPEALHDLTASDVLETSPGALAEKAGVGMQEVVRLREQLATLELALDQRVLGRMTVREIVAGEP